MEASSLSMRFRRMQWERRRRKNCLRCIHKLSSLHATLLDFRLYAFVYYISRGCVGLGTMIQFRKIMSLLSTHVLEVRRTISSISRVLVL